jgi:hypothetical protein
MTETLEGEVLHAIPPDELGDHALEPELQAMAESRYVLVCRRGGHPSIFGLLWAYIRGNPIEAVTVITDQPSTEGDSVSLVVEETRLVGVYTTETGGDGRANL